jgi:D-glycero-D-manno-heptose 1,7-bisphosphate phosphatase
MSAVPRSGSGQAAVFLDRDGTLIEDLGYIGRVDQVTVYPWTVRSILAFNRAGLRVVITTNQSGVARGYFDEAAVDEVHRHLAQVVDAGGARIDAFYYCPHHPKGEVEAYTLLCDCRKPGRGMIERASVDLGLDATLSYVVGDKWVDVALARAVGAKGLLVRTGYGAAEEAHPRPEVTADAIVDNLGEAAHWILNDLQSTIINPQS